MLSRVFPATHPRAGEPTEFKEKLQRKEKLHTIRANWPLWESRINDVRNGNAELSVRQWTGKPYRSKQVEIARLGAADGSSVDDPCFTLVARMDKVPPYLVQTEQGVGIAVFEDDSPMTRKIKEFMALYCITDIKMRMLKISELKAIMGFPPDYVLVGTQSEQKKYIGNAVEVNMSRVLCEALAERLEEAA